MLRYRNDEGLNARTASPARRARSRSAHSRLVSCLAKAGEIERAEALFDQLVGYMANDLGLLAEEMGCGR